MDTTCRACMKTSNILVSIFAPLKNTIMEADRCTCMADILNEISGYELVDKQIDSLPHYICANCIKSSELALEFKRMIQKSHQQLWERFNFVEDEENAIKVEQTVQSIENFEEVCNSLDQEDNYIESVEYAGHADDNRLHSYNTRQKNNHSSHQEVSGECAVRRRSRDRSSSPSKKKPKNISCPYCNIVLSCKGNLKTHIRIHTGERPFKCSYCPKAFIQKQNLTQHIRTHTGERPLKCPVCPKAYAHLSGITVHFRKHPDHARKRLRHGKEK